MTSPQRLHVASKDTESWRRLISPSAHVGTVGCVRGLGRSFVQRRGNGRGRPFRPYDPQRLWQLDRQTTDTMDLRLCNKPTHPERAAECCRPCVLILACIKDAPLSGGRRLLGGRPRLRLQRVVPCQTKDYFAFLRARTFQRESKRHRGRLSKATAVNAGPPLVGTGLGIGIARKIGTGPVLLSETMSDDNHGRCSSSGTKSGRHGKAAASQTPTNKLPNWRR